jgi:acyl CoA:acetate/3-ketoacid CoA transferase beta subunit
MVQLIAQGRLQIWIGAVQVDRWGASNISVVGPWEKPRVQLIGARGVPDDLWGCERLCYHVRTQTRRSFVERVDFECAFGHGERRDAYGGRAAPPGLVVTDLGVYDFDPEGAGMRVVSLHPGVSFETAQGRTAFPLLPPPSGEIPVTPAPSAEELACIRERIDPAGLRRLESAEANETLTLELWRRDRPEHRPIRP